MNPTVTNVQERNAQAANGQLTKVLVVTYKVGTLGPFTLITNPQEVSSGQAMAKMQQFAASLNQLPLAQQGS